MGERLVPAQHRIVTDPVLLGVQYTRGDCEF